MGGNQKKRNREKRKKSSDSGELDSKILRVGGSPGDSAQGHVNNGDVNIEESEWSSISDVIRETNKVLFEEKGSFCEESDRTVFDSPTSRKKDNNMEAKQPVPGNQASPTNNDIMTLLKQINGKMQNLEDKLKRIESVEKKVDRFEAELSKIWNFINDKYTKMDERIIKVEERMDETHFATGLTADKIKEMENAASSAKEDMLYMQSQSMRNNLIFSGIEDMEFESGEATEKKLRDFMTDKLLLAREIVSEIKFERVHRIGQKSVSHPTRQIVAKFCYFKDRESVKKMRSNLKGTRYYINEQFPKDIVERRKKLTPKMMEAKRQGKQARLSYDKLIVDGRQVEIGGTDA